MKKYKPDYKAESELCADFIEAAAAAGCTAYPETHGWDILLLQPDGTQVGVQAKLKPNLKVVAQCIEYLPTGKTGDALWLSRNWPDYIAVLIPAHDRSMSAVCNHLGITVLEPRQWLDWRDRPCFTPVNGEPWRSPVQRYELPEYVPDSIAGSPCPVTLSPWKIKAIKLCRTLRATGYLTAADFKNHGMRIDLWRDRWVISDGKRPATYTLKPGATLPDEKHPTISTLIDRELGYGTQ